MTPATQPELGGPRRTLRWLALAGCMVLLAACGRGQSTGDDTPQIAKAKAAVAHKLDSPDSAEFRNVVEFKDGVVCGEFNAKKMFSGTEIGFRKFIYNAPEPGRLAIDSGEIPPEDVSYWCSNQPDKRLRMLASSGAELARECAAAGGKSSDLSCRLAASQKQAMEALRPGSGAAVTASAPATTTAAATATTTATAASAQPPATQVSQAASAAAPVPPSVAPGPGAVASPSTAAAPGKAAAPAASSVQPAGPGGAVAAIPADVEVALRTWRERWEQGDVDGYLRMYEPSFTGGATSHGAWEQQRRQKMKDVRPSIGVEGLQAVRVAPEEVELRFVQVYAAKRHRDRGNKTMVFRRTPQGWLIADERWKALS